MIFKKKHSRSHKHADVDLLSSMSYFAQTGDIHQATFTDGVKDRFNIGAIFCCAVVDTYGGISGTHTQPDSHLVSQWSPCLSR